MSWQDGVPAGFHLPENLNLVPGDWRWCYHITIQVFFSANLWRTSEIGWVQCFYHWTYHGKCFYKKCITWFWGWALWMIFLYFMRSEYLIHAREHSGPQNSHRKFSLNRERF